MKVIHKSGMLFALMMSAAAITINPSFKQVTRCVSEARPDQNEVVRVSGANSKTIGPRVRIDMVKPQQADCHLFEARVNKDPVQIYYNGIDKFHSLVRRHTPFTYIAYSELLPTQSDSDFVGIVYKICYFVCFRFFIRLGVRTISPLIGFIPLIPFIADSIWVGYRWMTEKNVDQKEKASPLTTLFFLTLSGATLYLLNKSPDY